MRRHPGLGVLDDVHGPTLKPPESRSTGFRVKVVVLVEASIEPRRQLVAIQNNSSDKRGRGVATLLECFGNRYMLSIQRYAEVRNTVRAWVKPCKDARVRAVRDR